MDQGVTTVVAGSGWHRSPLSGRRLLPARLRAAAVTVSVAAALVPATGGTAAAALPADRIVYTEGDAAGMDLRVTGVDGGDARTLTSGSFDAEPTWSPDGGQVAFVRRDDLDERIMVVAADGTGLSTVTDGSGGAVWSPDGTLLAFVRQAREGADPTQDGVWLVRPDRSGPRRLAAGGTVPAWSPDGSALAFARGQRLYRVGVDGVEERLLADLPFAPSLLDWSPDGATLATAGFPDSDDSGVWVLSAAGGGLRRLTEPAVGLATRPVWSPDGTRLAFAAFRDGQADLWVIGADGTGLGQLTATASDEVFPDWSPDGTTLVFTRHEDITSFRAPRDLWVVGADGGGLRQVTTSGTAGTAAFAPGGVLRVAGPSRVHTAVALSRRVSSAEAVVLARDDAYADALAAGPLAARLGAPLLLTPGSGLHPAAAAEIVRLGATSAYLMGGPAALSEQVATDLRAAGVTEVGRVGGVTRFDTARVVAQTVTATAAYVVEGANADPARGWPDAVAVSALAAFQQRPILLVERGRLPDETAAALRDLGPSARVTVVGGEHAVSTAVADAVAAQGMVVDRVAGTTRYHTSRLLAEQGLLAGMGPASAWVANGRDWPDALTAGPAAAADGGVLLLADGHAPSGSPPAGGWLMQHAPGLQRLVLVGGPAAIIPAVRVELLRAARGDCPNEPRVVADPDHHQPGALSGDVDGDGGTDVVQLAVDQGGPEGCQAFLVVVTPSRRTSVPTGSTPQPPGAGGPLPRVHGLVDIGDRPGLEVVVDLEAGASTDILGVFTMGDGELEPVTIAGERHVVALFPYGGSVGHQDTVDCTSDGDMVTASATIDDDGRFYRVERRFYRLDGAMLHLVGGDQQDVPAGDDGPPALPEPFGGPPFGGCPR